MQTEQLRGIIPVVCQVIMQAKFEWIVEAQDIVKHQSQPNQHCRHNRCRKHRTNPPARTWLSCCTPRLNHRHQKDYHTKQQGGS